MSVPPAASRGRLRAPAFIVGAVLLGVSAVGGAVTGADQFFRAYLTAFLFWTGIAVGCLGWALLHQLTGGEWGVAIETIVQSAARTLPFLALGMIPLLFALPDLYEWARPDAIAADTRLAHKRAYLNVPFFVVRTVVYFAVWSVVAWLLDRWSRTRAGRVDLASGRRLERLGAGGALAYALTVSFAAMDWIMSLEPAWYSTVYGAMVGVGWMLAAFAFIVLVNLLSAGQAPIAGAMRDKVRIDLGNLLLTFVILWTYLAFVQLLIIWVGNVPEEVVWYVRRLRGGWQGLAIFLAVFQFLVPLFVLLFRDAKTSRPVMIALTVVILVSHWINMVWLVTPVFHPARFAVHWLQFITTIGLGGVWVGLFLWLREARPAVPMPGPASPARTIQYARR